MVEGRHQARGDCDSEEHGAGTAPTVIVPLTLVHTMMRPQTCPCLSLPKLGRRLLSPSARLRSAVWQARLCAVYVVGTFPLHKDDVRGMKGCSHICSLSPPRLLLESFLVMLCFCSHSRNQFVILSCLLCVAILTV